MIRQLTEVLGAFMRRGDAPTWWLAGLATLSALMASLTAPVTGAQNPSLLFSTPITGGSPVRMTVDTQGYIYLAGQTRSSAPTSTSSFVMKLTPSRSVVYTTYLPIEPFDYESFNCDVAITAIAADRNGAAYITGCTSARNFPLANPFRSTFQGRSSAFVTKLSPTGSLVYSTYFGGGDYDEGTGIAVDDQGNAYVVGTTTGQKLPLVTAAEPLGEGFAAKFDPSGSKLLYSTYLSASPSAIAVDRFGAAYIAGAAGRRLPTIRPIQPCHDDYDGDASVIKLSPTGSSYEYAICFGGSRIDAASGIDVDAGGSAYVVGTTSSMDFPTVHPVDATGRTGPLWTSDDSGLTWRSLPLDSSPIYDLASSSASANTWYAGTGDGAFESTDGGTQWRRLGQPIRDSRTHTTVFQVVTDPRAPSTLYAIADEGLFKSIDRGEHWTSIGAGLPRLNQGGASVGNLTINPADSREMYGGSEKSFWKSIDGGATWAPSNRGLDTQGFVGGLSLDATTGTLYAVVRRRALPVSTDRVFRSTDAGAHWTPTSMEIRTSAISAVVAVPSRHPPASRLPRVPDRDATDIKPGTVYVASVSVTGDPFGGLSRSDDDGNTWTTIGRGLPLAGPDSLAVAPSDPQIVYAASNGVVFISRNRGDTFEPIAGRVYFGRVESLAVDPNRAATLFVGTSAHQDAFIAKIRPGGGSLEYSTYLGGTYEDRSAGVVVDELGRAIVFGSTTSTDFPTVTPVQEKRDGGAFVSVLDGGGSVLLFSTSLGAGSDDIVSAVRFGRGILISGGSSDLARMFPGSASGAGSFVAMLDLSLSAAPFRLARRP